MIRASIRASFSKIKGAAIRPVDAGSIQAFRILFGLLVAGAAVRFMANGWVDEWLAAPAFHFRYYGFAWVPVFPRAGLYAVMSVVALSGMAVALGWRTRIAAAVLAIAFGYIELVDVTYYLNHYYLVVLEAVLVSLLPTATLLSLDAKAGRVARSRTVPAWVLWLLRFQVAIVYFYAGVAKLNPDWLLAGQPLATWLRARVETPVLGTLFSHPFAAVAMSWAGCLHDLLIPFALLWKRTRGLAYVALVGFHAVTGWLFPIGVFPLIMIVSATLFFDPSWPNFVFRKLSDFEPFQANSKIYAWTPAMRRSAAAALVFALFQTLFPLRAFLYGGDVLWHEQGMRWSWRVMLREKNASVVFRVRSDKTNTETLVPPRWYLTRWQEREMGSQPDLILQLAHHVADDFRRRGAGDVEVRADAIASLNGRRAEVLIDPDVDLSRVEDGLGRAAWILPRRFR